LSCLEAAEVLGISERHFRRLRDRYEADGAEGLIDRRRGRVSGRRVAVDRIEWVLEQYRTRYFDFTVKHFHERLMSAQKFELSYTWTKRVLQTAGLGAAAVGPPQEAPQAANAGDDAVPGRLAASLAGRGATVRSGGDDG
jgi:transposase